MTGRQHLDYLDIAKGIGILAVVLGHCVPKNIFNGNSNLDMIAGYIYGFVYSFHMPLFFFISGYLTKKVHNGQEAINILITKAKRLLIPYISFSFIYIPLRIFYSNMAISNYSQPIWKILIGVSPNGGVWFLYVLFMCSILCILLDLKNVKVIFLVAIGAVMNFIIVFGLIKLDYDIINLFMRNFFYFAIGIAVKQQIFDKQVVLMSNSLILRIILFFVLFIFLELKISNIGSFLLPLLGISIVLTISKLIKYNKRLIYFGLNSIHIYLLHGPILVLLRYIAIKLAIPKIFIIPLLFFLSVLLSCMFTKIIKLSKIMNKIMFGI